MVADVVRSSASGLVERGVPSACIAFLEARASMVAEGERLAYVSPAFERLVGFDCQDRVGQPPPHPWWPPEDVPALSRALASFTETFPAGAKEPMGVSFSLRLLRSGGRRSRALVEARVGWPPADEPILLHTTVFSAIEDETGRMRATSPQDLIDHIKQCTREITSSLELLGLRAPQGVPFEASPRLFALSPRERELVSLMLADAEIGAMAETLAISRNTVRNHVRTIYRKLGVHSRDELVRIVAVESLTSHPRLWIRGAAPAAATHGD